MNLFECLEYREWFKRWLSAKPSGGRGELSQIARYLEVNSTLISQVLSKRRDFSLEQGYALCQYFSFNPLETRYFMALLQAERAGTQTLRKHFESEIKTLRQEAGQIKNRLETDREINDTDKSFLVSTWKPTAMLVLSGRKNGVTLDGIAQALNLPKDSARELAHKLAEIGLVQQSEGRFSTGVKRLHIPKGSSFLLRHYSNWRLKAIEQCDDVRDDEVMYTSVSSISGSDVAKLKEKLLQVISEYAKAVSESPAEDVVCFNLDFFRVR